MSVRLKVVEGKPQGATIALHGKWFYIGRDPACQLRPKHDTVGDRHCALFLEGDYVEIKDLGCQAGTILNGRKLKPSISTPVHNGDKIQVGPLLFEIEVETPKSAQPITEGPLHTHEGSLLDDDDEPSTSRIANRLIQRELGQGADPTKAVGTHLHAVMSEGVPCVTLDMPRISDQMIPTLKKELANLAERPALTRLILDMRKVRHADDAAAEIFLAFDKKLRDRGARLKLCELAPEVMDVLTKHGVLEQVPSFLDCHDAIWSAW